MMVKESPDKKKKKKEAFKYSRTSFPFILASPGGLQNLGEQES